MAAERLPKEIYKTWECSLMFTSKWALETDLWNIEKKKFNLSKKNPTLFEEFH